MLNFQGVNLWLIPDGHDEGLMFRWDCEENLHGPQVLQN